MIQPGNGTLTYTSVTDTANNLANNAGFYIAAGKNVTITDAVTIAQPSSIDADNIGGTHTYTSVTDTAKILTNNAGNYVNGSVNVTFTNDATISQIGLVSGSTTGDLTVTIDESEATDNLITIINASQAVAEGIQQASNFTQFKYKITGIDNANTYTGSIKDDILIGYGGNDELTGKGGADTLKADGAETILRAGKAKTS